jgi:eukaryotic-like serine/threonine-protein kinase
MTVVRSPESLRPGNLVGPWLIEGYAGRGSYGLVYRARRAELPASPPVALKLAAFANDPRFAREAVLLSRFHHPSMPRLLDRGGWCAGPGAQHPYLVLEWVSGQPLYEWARVHTPTCREALQVLAQVARALEVLHRSQCLHRDVKGDNVLVERDGRTLLTDFGSGTWAGAPPITETLMPPNTPEYRSPEALRFLWKNWHQKEARYEAGPADDVYALVTRVYPPPGTAPEELKSRLQEPAERRLSARALNERVVPALSDLIEQMLEGSPEARSPAKVVAELAEAAARQQGPEADVPLFSAKQSAIEHAPARGDIVTRRPSGLSRLRVAAVSGVLLLVTGSALQLGYWPRMIMQAVAPDVETMGLGEDSLTSREVAQEATPGPEPISRDMERQPLPGQRRPPCQRTGALVINGGCWKLQANIEAPCDDDDYEWQGACYRPIYDRRRVPNTRDSK